MDDYQTFEQRGVQELVVVSMDEEGLPCIYQQDIERVFPNVCAISSYGVPIPFTNNGYGVPKQPLRIPYFENRVLEIRTDDSALEWSREATASRIAAAATIPRTVHTPLVNVDSDGLYASDDDDSDISFSMVESDAESEEEEEEGDEANELDELFTSTLAAVHNTTASIEPSPSATQSFDRLLIRPDGPTSVSADSAMPPAFEYAVASGTWGQIASTTTSNHFHSVPDEEETDDMQALPSYELLNSGPPLVRSHHTGDISRTPATLDDPSERHLVHDRVGIIKRISQAILSQKYDASECLHPPLFIILPENPSRWSFDNILHNKMRLYFLCDCCEHEIHTHDSRDSRGRSNKRNIHVDESSGFEIRMDQFQDQMLFIKFGHYILNLLRMLQYGVSLDDMFVAAAFDRPVPPLMGNNRSGPDPRLFFQLKQNVDRSIAFMEALLGDEYDDEMSEVVKRLGINDFRLLDWIVKREPYAQQQNPSSSATSDQEREAALLDCYQGGSGLYKVLVQNNVRWSCVKYYDLQHKSLDKIFSNKLEFLHIAMKPQTRATTFFGSTENMINTRIIAVSKIRVLFQVDFTIDWDFEKAHLNTLADMIKREAMAVSAIGIRIGKNRSPLTWRLHTDSDERQPILAIVNLFKRQKIKRVALEGDIDLFSVPNIGTMDFTNLDVLSIMKTNNRRPPSGTGDRTPPKYYTTESYIPELATFLQSCSFLTELSLGFPDLVPGHLRILQLCASTLSRLCRLDLFRMLNTTTNLPTPAGFTVGSNVPGSNNAHGPIQVSDRRLELSASFVASKTTRLYLSECKTTNEGKLRLLESLEEVLTDDGAHLEDLEIRYIGFNDKHAHALEFGTRSTSGSQDCCRLRRLVIHGKGLESRGVSALKRVLKRASHNTRQGQGGPGGVTIAIAASTDADTESPNFGTMLDVSTLTHLELRAMDSLNDQDWYRLLLGLDPRNLITLDLQGVWFGDRAVAALGSVHDAAVAEGTESPPLSPISPSSPFPPPAFFSSSAPLQLQTLRLNCFSLSMKGLGHLQGFLSRLIHLSTISLQGFRNVNAEDWIDLLGRINFRWIERVEIVSSGYDDGCAQYLGDRIESREQTAEVEDEPQLPAYSASPAATSSPSPAAPSSSSPTKAAPVDGNRAMRRDSLSTRLFSVGGSGGGSGATLVATMAGTSSYSKDKKSKETEKPLPTPAPALPKPNPSHKYLEIDLRYTDVSAKGLAVLRGRVQGLAKKVVVMSRDGDENEVVVEVEENFGAKVGSEKEQLARRLVTSTSSSSAAYSSSLAAAPSLSSSSSSANAGPSNGSSSSSSSLSTAASAAQAQSTSSGHSRARSSFFSKLKGSF